MSDAPGGEARRKWIALGVLLALSLPLVVIALLTSGSESGAGLRIERGTPQATGGAITVYVDDPAQNVPGTADGARNVRLECFGRNDRLLRRSTHPWPFTDTDNATLDPHVHERMPQQQVDQVVSCRLAGTDGPLEGRVSAAPRG